jgi:hypothetical protein
VGVHRAKELTVRENPFDDPSWRDVFACHPFFQRHFCFFPVPLSMLECARIAGVPSVLDEKQP